MVKIDPDGLIRLDLNNPRLSGESSDTAEGRTSRSHRNTQQTSADDLEPGLSRQWPEVGKNR